MSYIFKTIKAAGRHIDLYFHDAAEPLVILNSGENEGDALWELFESPSFASASSFSLAVVKDIDWNLDMSPWQQDAIFKRGESFGGGADAYLWQLEEEMLPEIEANLSCPPTETVLAGYSLAGLFAVYAAYRSDRFNSIVSASGSLWFPGFLDFAKEHVLSGSVKSVYFSLGDREAKTKNEVMASVEKNTEILMELVKNSGVSTTFQLNPGNHFQDDALRLAKGIFWTLEQM